MAGTCSENAGNEVALHETIAVGVLQSPEKERNVPWIDHALKSPHLRQAAKMGEKDPETEADEQPVSP